jgi:hypothetical protein
VKRRFYAKREKRVNTFSIFFTICGDEATGVADRCLLAREGLLQQALIVAL